jgi:hypothetical protein
MSDVSFLQLAKKYPKRSAGEDRDSQIMFFFFENAQYLRDRFDIKSSSPSSSSS